MSATDWEPGLCTNCLGELKGKHICYWQTKRVCTTCYTELDNIDRYGSSYPDQSRVSTALKAALVVFFGFTALFLVGHLLAVWQRS